MAIKVNSWQIPLLSRLSGYVDRIWGWEGHAHSFFPEMLPGTGAECFFCFGGQIFIHNLQTGKKILAPRFFLLCNRSHSLQFEAAGKVDFLSVRFCSGRLRHFLPCQFREVFDQITNFADIWGESFQSLKHMLDQETDFVSRATLLETFFSEKFIEPGARDQLLDCVIDTLYYDPSIRINELAREVGWSRRNLDKHFFNAFGQAPKHFARVARLQRMLKKMILSKTSKFTDLVHEVGYFDQSHFCHDLKSLTGFTSLRLRQSQIMERSFYFPANSIRPNIGLIKIAAG